MTDEIEIEGTDVDAAVETALKKLGVSRNQVDIEILDMPSKGLLGLGAKEARIKVKIKNEINKESIQKVVKDILDLIGLSAEITVEESDTGPMINISGENLGILIGKYGNTLEALQFLVNIIINKNKLTPRKVLMDIGDYRKQRAKEIKELAERVIGKVLARQQAVTLRPMNAYERKIVHTTVGEYSGVSSLSIGDEPERQVTISPSHDKTT